MALRGLSLKSPGKAWHGCVLASSSAANSARTISTSVTPPSTPLVAKPPHLLSLADVTVPQMQTILTSAAAFKKHFKAAAIPGGVTLKDELGLSSMPLRGKTVALMFSKRSTRTRLASESGVALLGGHPIFLGASDIQLGVNETLYDTSRVVSSMVDGIMARVGDHSEIEVRDLNEKSCALLNCLLTRLL